MDATEHGKTVLAAILPRQGKPAGSRDLLDYCLRHLTPLHFPDPVQAKIFAFAERYLDFTGCVLPRQALSDVLRQSGSPPGTVLLYEQYFDLLTGWQFMVDPRWSVQQLRSLAAERMTGEALAQAMEILTRGARDGKRDLRGPEDARSWLMAQFGAIDRELHQQDAPEGDMRTETRDLVAAYASRHLQHAQGIRPGVGTSIPSLDKALGGGLQNGELCLLAAATTVGKSSVCAQMAWHACVMEGKSVVVFTTETLRDQIRTKIIARHSRLPQFGMRDEGLNSTDIKAGSLEHDPAMLLQNVILPDFGTNPAYGRCYVAQVPRGATISVIESRLARLATVWEADLVIIDYLQLLRPESARNARWEEQSSIVKDGKELARSYRDGRGVPVVSPWQFGRPGQERANAGKQFELTDLSETQEAANTPDVVLALKHVAGSGRRAQLELSILKNRDGERGKPVELNGDYATSYFTERSGDQSGLLNGPQDGTF